MLPEGTAVEIDRGSWEVPPLFEMMREIGNVSEPEMYRTFIMGVGMVVVCSPADARSVKTHLDNLGETCYTIGRVTEGARQVLLA